MSSKQEVDSLMCVADELIGLMNAETALLREMDIKGAGPLQPEKTRLTDSYEKSVRRLADDPQSLRDLDPDLKETFGELMVRFKRAAGENEVALKAAKQAHDTLFQAVLKAAETQRGDRGGYGDDGARSGQAAKSGGEPLSLTLDRQL